MKSKKNVQPVSKASDLLPKSSSSKAPAATIPHAPLFQDIPAFLERMVRWLLLFFAATLPLYYDLAVPEVSGDIRWTATNFFAGSTLLLLLTAALLRKNNQLSMRWQPVFWFALGLSMWAAVSLIDALNWMRGIQLIKALYAQLTLLVVVFFVANPVFIRRLMWALVLPMFVTSFIGIAQFWNWNDASVHAWLNHTVVLAWVSPLMDLVGMVLRTLMSWWRAWPQQCLVDGQPAFCGLIDQLTGYFQQSAVPGSSFANKNLAGSWTAMMLPLALYLLVTSKHRAGQIFSSVLLTMGGLFLAYSRARASWVALTASLLLLAVLVVAVPAWRKAVARHLDRRHLLWLAVPVLVIGLFGGKTSPIHGAHAVDRTPGQQVAALVNSSWDEIGGRVAYNLNSLAITRDYWFNGVGLGSFYVIYPAYHNAQVATPTNSYSVMARPQRTHTDLMQAFDEMGIPGGIFYAGLFIVSLIAAFRLGGARAGGLAGNLTGSGLITGILLLSVFLERQNMLAMPEPWGWIFHGFLGVLVLGLLGRAYRNFQLVQREQKAADDTQLLGLMAGISVLTISINALMDFPMQLPTAPAAACLLMGAIAALAAQYRSVSPWGPPVPLPVKPSVIVVAMVVAALAWVCALRDDMLFRAANVRLKGAMVLVMSGASNEQALQILEDAHRIYPYDPRIHEYMGVAYANYNGASPMPIEARIERLEWVIAGDFWGANHLVNLAGQYLQLAEFHAQQGNFDEVARIDRRLNELYQRLQRSAGFSHFTWGVGGMLRLLENKPQEALELFRRALAIDPTYRPAISGLSLAAQRLGLSPQQAFEGISPAVVVSP